MGSGLSGRRVLIVEDEWMLRMLLVETLQELGCAAAETAAGLEEAVAKAETVACDLAVIDINLNGRPSYPVAEALAARGIPFVFATGYGAAGLREGYRGVPVLQKPFDPADLERALLAALEAPSQA